MNHDRSTMFCGEDCCADGAGDAHDESASNGDADYVGDGCGQCYEGQDSHADECLYDSVSNGEDAGDMRMTLNLTTMLLMSKIMILVMFG